MAITPKDMEMLAEMAKAMKTSSEGAVAKVAPVHYTITGAEDWPMFQFMLGGFGLAWVLIVGLLVYIWKDLKVRIGSQRAEDAKGCETCKKAIWDHIAGPIWNAIEACCVDFTDVEKQRLQAEIQKQTQGVADA